MKKVVLLVVSILIIATMSMTFVSCNKNEDVSTLTFSMPDGTPALSAAQFLGNDVEINGENTSYKISSNVIAASSVPTQLAGELSDMLIVPTNAGAASIAQGANYKLAAVMVKGSLYVVSNGTGDINLLDLKGKKLAMIGQGNTPEKVFNYVVNNTDGIELTDIEIEGCDDATAAMAALSRVSNSCDYALVGEPAATALGAKGYTKRLNIQSLYSSISGYENFPQASLFVKTPLYNDKTFMKNLFEKLEDSQTWIKVSAQTSTAPIALNDELSVSKFPPASISRCEICVLKTESNEVKNMVTSYLKLVVPIKNWEDIALF